MSSEPEPFTGSLPKREHEPNHAHPPNQGTGAETAYAERVVPVRPVRVRCSRPGSGFMSRIHPPSNERHSITVVTRVTGQVRPYP